MSKDHKATGRLPLVSAVPRSGIPPSPRLDRKIQDRLGHELRTMYNALAEEPLPERFTAVLSRIDPQGGNGRW